MNVIVERIPSVIEKLESIRRRPQVTLGTVESTSLGHYLWGFREAVHLFAYFKYWDTYLRIIEQVAYDRGWPMNLDFVKSIRARGLSEQDIIEEALIIEIESWRRFAALFTSGNEANTPSSG